MRYSFSCLAPYDALAIFAWSQKASVLIAASPSALNVRSNKRLPERVPRHEASSIHKAECGEPVMPLFPLARSQKKPTALMAWAAMSNSMTRIALQNGIFPKG